jgi:hypothetical protein
VLSVRTILKLRTLTFDANTCSSSMMTGLTASGASADAAFIALITLPLSENKNGAVRMPHERL